MNNLNNGAGAAAAAAAAAASGASLRAVARVPVDVDISRQDALRACNPDIERPFASLEDACHRLLPFHVLADYDADDVNGKFLDSTGRVLSRSQLWNESLTAKINEFKATLQKQIDVFNSLSKKRAEGEMRAEEGLMIEQLLMQDEKQKVMDMKVEMDREKAERDAEVRMKEAIAQAERARAEQARLQEAVRQAQAQAQAQAHHAARIPPQVGGVHMLGEPYRFVGAAQMQEEDNIGLDSASPEQEGMVDDMLDDWDEDANESINLLATHSGSEAGMLDLNSLTSTR